MFALLQYLEDALTTIFHSALLPGSKKPPFSYEKGGKARRRLAAGCHRRLALRPFSFASRIFTRFAFFVLLSCIAWMR